MLPKSAARLYSYAREYKSRYLLSVGFFVLASAMEPLIPALLGLVLNEGFAKSPQFPVWLVPVALVAVFIVRGLFGFCGQYTMASANAQTVLGLRRDLVKALLHADAQLFHEVTPGLAVAKVINDPQVATTQIGGAISTALRDGTHTIAMLCYLLYLNWQLTLLSLVTLPLLAYTVRRVHKRVKDVGGQLYGSQMKLVSVVDDIARAWRVVRTFDAGHFEFSRFNRLADDHRRMTIKSSSAGALLTPLSQAITSVGVALILLMALMQARTDATSVGEFVSFIAALLLLVSRVRSLTDIAQTVTMGLIQAEGCFGIMDAPPEPDPGHTELVDVQGRVTLDGVRVVYPGAGTAALNRMSMEIPAGSSVALVGPSGAGKTTVVSLLLGFVMPDEGRVCIDGVSLTEVRKASLRQQFAVVSQDIVLFDGSIADNVVYALPRDDVKLERCLRAAHLWDFVHSLPSSVETHVGTNGSKLSGGQRQRLAIARALYKDAPIWIFDEATSALDTESERAVQSALESWHGKKTLIIIAHRLSTVRNADNIFVLGEGRVLESGSDVELRAQGGIYARMIDAQMG